MADGTIKYVMWETERPETKGKVRMRTLLAGVIFTPLKEDPTKTKVKFLLEGELGGMIPYWIQRQAISWTAGGFAKYRQLMPDFMQNNPHVLSTPFFEQ